MSRLRAFAWRFSPPLFVLTFFGLGMLGGRWLTLIPFTRQIKEWSRAETLGRIVPDDPQRSERAKAYYDPAAAVRDMDDYSWAVPNVPTPFVGCAPQPGQHANAHINSLQMRADHEVAMPKPAGTVRLFLTGGSTAYGSGAPSQDRTIGGYLEQLLNRELTPVTAQHYEVFTMATPAWASTEERIAIENRLNDLAPDLVVSFSGNNDVLFGKLGRNSLWLRSYVDEHYFELLSMIFAKAGNGPISDVADHGDAPVEPALVAQRLEKNIRLANFALSPAGARYVFALQPTLAVSTKRLTAREQTILDKSEALARTYFPEAYRALRSQLAAIDLPGFTYLDLSDVFGGRADSEEIFIDSYHFGDRGNEIIARALFAGLRPLLAGSEAYPHIAAARL